MTKKYPILATADEIRTIARRAMILIDAVNESDDDSWNDPDANRAEHLAVRGAQEAMRFCATAAALLGDGSLLQVIGEFIDELGHWDDYGYSHVGTVAAGLGELLRRGATVNEMTVDLAKHNNDTIRIEIARGLRPTSDKAIELLERLAADPIAHVRTYARESLASRGEVPWWAGKFTSDPLANLSSEDAERLREPIEGISALLDESRWTLKDRDERLAKLVAPLPDSIAIGVVELVLGSGNRYSAVMPEICTDMLSREGGIEGLIRVLERWSATNQFYINSGISALISKLEPNRATEVCRTLAQYALNSSPAQRDKISACHCLAADLVANGLPSAADRGPFIDMLLEDLSKPDRDMRATDFVVSKLAEALGREGAEPGPHTARLLEARLANYPGPWAKIGNTIDKLLQRAPVEPLRAAAEVALRSDDDKLAKWGLHCLTGPVHRVDTDGTRIEFATRLCDDPRFRTLMLTDLHLAKIAISPLRAMFRRNELDFVMTCMAIRVIGEFWGGPLMPYVTRVALDTGKIEETRAQTRAKYQDCLGPEELHGPVSDAEWDILRRVREPMLSHDEPPWMELLCILPDGSWHPADRALLERAVAACEHSERIAFPVMLCLSTKATVNELPIFEQLLQFTTKSDRAFYRGQYYELRERLGLPKKPEAVGGEQQEPTGDWMDDED